MAPQRLESYYGRRKRNPTGVVNLETALIFRVLPMYLWEIVAIASPIGKSASGC
jgi:hypothetical protein